MAYVSYRVGLNDSDGVVRGFPVAEIPRQFTQVLGDRSVTPQSHFLLMEVDPGSPNQLDSVSAATEMAFKAN